MLQGEKIILRALEPSDVDLLMRWENNSDYWYLSGTVQPFSRAVLENYVANAAQDIFTTGQLRLIIESKPEGTAMGTIDLFDFDAFHGRAGIGILIAQEAHRGQGFGAEALALLKQYAFDYLGLKQLYCNVLASNTQSISLFEKAGFELSGTKKAWIRRGDSFEDELLLQLIK